MAFDQLMLSLENLEKRLAGAKELVLGGRQFVEKELGEIEGAAERSEQAVASVIESMKDQVDEASAILQGKMAEIAAALDVSVIGATLDAKFEELAASLDFQPGVVSAPGLGTFPSSGGGEDGEG